MKKKTQSQPLRIECPDYWSLCTSRTVQSRLWFVNNPELENHVLKYVARYQAKYLVEIFAFVLMGNHYHIVARFPFSNRRGFMRDLNARIAEGVRLHVHEFDSGSLFARRYAEQALIEHFDVEEYFFYCALQPVLSGLAERLQEYPGYNSFYDALSGVPLKIRDFHASGYKAKKRHNKNTRKDEFVTIRELVYSRLPGYERLSQEEYRKEIIKKFEARRSIIVDARLAEGKRFVGMKKLCATKPGARPHSTKTSTRESKRPLVLTRNPEAKRLFLEWYFTVLAAYKLASQKYIAGNITVSFPPGTYRPSSFVPI